MSNREAVQRVEDLDVGALVVRTATGVVKQHPVGVSLWLLGVLLAAFASGMAVDETTRQAYSMTLEHAYQVDRDELAKAERNYRRAEAAYNSAKGWFWSCDDKCRIMQDKFVMAQTELNRVQVKRDRIVTDARREVGIWSEYGVQDVRNNFWDSWKSGKDMAARWTMMDAMFTMIGGREESLLAAVAKIAVVRFAGTGLAYTWEEGGAAGNEVRVYIPLAASVGLRDVNVSLSQQRIRVDVAGRGTVLEGHLWRAVDVEESMWVIEEHKGQRSVVVSLDKEATWERWEHLLKRSGIPGCGYSWEQSGRFNEEVRIHIPVSEGVTAKDVELEVAERRIRLALPPAAAAAAGEEEEAAPAAAAAPPGPEPVLEGTLWGEVDMKEGASWMFEERGGQRCITVTLEKVHVRESWERLLERDPHREGSAGCGSLGSEPGTRKDVDISVLGSLEQVEYYLQQRRVDEAQELMDIMTREIDDELPDP